MTIIKKEVGTDFSSMQECIEAYKELGNEYSCIQECIEDYNAGNKDLLEYMQYIVSELDRFRKSRKKMTSLYQVLLCLMQSISKNEQYQRMITLSKEELMDHKSIMKLLNEYIHQVKNTEDYTSLDCVQDIIFHLDTFEHITEYIQYLLCFTKEYDIVIDTSYFETKEEEKQERNKKIEQLKWIVEKKKE